MAGKDDGHERRTIHEQGKLPASTEAVPTTPQIEAWNAKVLRGEPLDDNEGAAFQWYMAQREADVRSTWLQFSDAAGGHGGELSPEERARQFLLAEIARGASVPSITACAKHVGCTRQAADKWQEFRATFERAKRAEAASRPSIRRGYRDARTDGIDAEA